MIEEGLLLLYFMAVQIVFFNILIFLILVGGMISMIAAREVVQTLVYYKSMAADQKALASIEINLEDIPEGKVYFFILENIFKMKDFIF